MTDSPPPASERRRFTRFQFSGSVRLYSSGAVWETEVIDLSLRGALVTRPPGWNGKLGANYRLELRLHGTIMISMGVVAAHVDEQQIGLRCERLDWDSFLHLKRLVEMNLGDGEQLNRELGAMG